MYCAKSTQEEKDIALHEKDIALHEKDIALHEKECILHEKNIAHREKDIALFERERRLLEYMKATDKKESDLLVIMKENDKRELDLHIREKSFDRQTLDEEWERLNDREVEFNKTEQGLNIVALNVRNQNLYRKKHKLKQLQRRLKSWLQDLRLGIITSSSIEREPISSPSELSEDSD